MLELIFVILLIMFVSRLFIVGIRASWGIIKILCSTVIFPIIMIGMAFAGLIYFALPLLVIILIALFVISLVRT